MIKKVLDSLCYNLDMKLLYGAVLGKYLRKYVDKIKKAMKNDEI